MRKSRKGRFLKDVKRDMKNCLSYCNRDFSAARVSFSSKRDKLGGVGGASGKAAIANLNMVTVQYYVLDVMGHDNT